MPGPSPGSSPGPAPAAVATEVADLKKAVAQVVPARTDSNLLIGSWNLRALAGLTESWDADEHASPKRDLRATSLIAAVLGAFDVVAVQEVRRDTTALRAVLAALGPDWQFLCSDVTEGDAGNGERLTFVYDSTRVRPSGLVGEVVLPPVAGRAASQFARTPYAVSFVRGDVEVILTTVHIVWDTAAADRVPEVTAFAEWMHDWAVRPGDWNGNLLVLGDFNLEGPGTPLYQAFVSTGLFPPGQISNLPRTIFDSTDHPHHYDQIAWFSDVAADGTMHNLLHGLDFSGHAGSFDFVPHVFPGLSKTSVSWRISDHFPLWVEMTLTQPTP
ncbi:MAG: endonuclease/exonuclease/phosphatase family protein [Marmoricola sp.]